MKRMILILSIGTFILGSCKKDRTCECNGTVTTSIPGVTSTTQNVTSTSTILKSSKKDAETQCTNVGVTNEQNYQSVPYTSVTMNCELK